jgi:hypothetical protein
MSENATSQPTLGNNFVIAEMPNSSRYDQYPGNWPPNLQQFQNQGSGQLGQGEMSQGRQPGHGVTFTQQQNAEKGGLENITQIGPRENLEYLGNENIFSSSNAKN